MRQSCLSASTTTNKPSVRLRYAAPVHSFMHIEHSSQRYSVATAAPPTTLPAYNTEKRSPTLCFGGNSNTCKKKQYSLTPWRKCSPRPRKSPGAQCREEKVVIRRPHKPEKRVRLPPLPPKPSGIGRNAVITDLTQALHTPPAHGRKRGMPRPAAFRISFHEISTGPRLHPGAKERRVFLSLTCIGRCFS
jgi:hypothetical protein